MGIPDEDLQHMSDDEFPQNELTFTEFIYACNDSLSPDAQASDKLANLMLSGLTHDLQEVVVNSTCEEYTIPYPANEQNSGFFYDIGTSGVVRDYDSLLATSRTLPYISALKIYAVARSADSLTKDVHINYPVRMPTKVGFRSL
jgi:hypothetical protein